MRNRARRVELARCVPGLAALLAAPDALAHVGVGDTVGFVHGFGHPLGGIDHVLAMIAVGLWAAQRGGRDVWLIPATFMCVMAAAGFAATLGVAVPFAEQGIVASVTVLGVLIAAAIRLPLIAGALVVGLFAACHGYAHGAEIPVSASGMAYGAGFLCATALLHATGIGLAMSTQGARRERMLRISGAAIATAGAYLWLTA